jgi:hypothetical protein
MGGRDASHPDSSARGMMRLMLMRLPAHELRRQRNARGRLDPFARLSIRIRPV